MHDPYLYSDVPVLQNKLCIRTEKTLDLIEAEQSRTNMMLRGVCGRFRTIILPAVENSPFL